MLDFRMDTLLMACKYLNFTKAAEKLGITQPGVSQHIRYLEENYNIKIFKYEGKKMSLTKEGKVLLHAVKTIKHDDDFLRGQLNEMKNGKRKLVFGTTLTIGEFVIPERLASYLKEHPDTAIQMVVSNTYHLLKGIDNGEIDFAIIEGYFAKRDYDYLTYSREKYIPICGYEYKLSGNGESIEDLLAERLITREPGSGTREILERLLEEKNLVVEDFENVVEVSNMKAIKSLVALNCGITFLYEVAAREEIKACRLKEIKLNEYGVTHDFNFVWRKGSIFAEEYEALFKELKLKG